MEGCSGRRANRAAGVWRQAGQLAGVQGLSSRWTRVVTAARDGRVWYSRQIQVKQASNTASTSRKDSAAVIIDDLMR